MAAPRRSRGLIIFGGTTNNVIGLKPDGSGNGNQIAFNYAAGVLVDDTNTMGIAIRGNSIFSNGGLGIDLNNDGVTTNDTGDADMGPNGLQNFPVITNALASGANTVISGKLNSTPNNSFFIDVYRNLSPDSSGYGEGQVYVGTVSVNTDGSGNAGFALTDTGNYAGQYFTATATSAGGDTSEFSTNLLAVAGPAAQFVGPFQSGASGFAFSLALQTNFSYRIQAATNLVAPIAWADLTNFTATSTPFSFADRAATNYRVRFYRVVSP